MRFAIGALLLIAALALGQIVSRLRLSFARRRAPREAWAALDQADHARRADVEEGIRATYSPAWLNAIALLPLPLLVGGFVTIVYGLWHLDSPWLRYSLAYAAVGVIVTVFHLSAGDVGARGVAVTALAGIVAWPLFLWYRISTILHDRRMGREPAITFGQLFFLAVCGFWLYGLFTTFFHGRLPLLGWTTNRNLVLGALWLLVFGVAAPVPAKAFMNFSGFVAATRHGRAYWPLFFGNVLFQLYFWILAITIWFPQPQPWPFSFLEGGAIRGLLALPALIALAAMGNLICVRVLQRLSTEIKTQASLDQ